MRQATANCDPKTPTKSRLPGVASKDFCSPAKNGGVENCDPNVAARARSVTPVKALKSRTLVSLREESENFSTPPAAEQEAVCHLTGSCPKASREQPSGITPTPARKHFCKSARCAANDPDYAVPAAVQPRKFLLSKRHLLHQQLEESLNRNKKSPCVGTATSLCGSHHKATACGLNSVASEGGGAEGDTCIRSHALEGCHVEVQATNLSGCMEKSCSPRGMEIDPGKEDRKEEVQVCRDKEAVETTPDELNISSELVDTGVAVLGASPTSKAGMETDSDLDLRRSEVGGSVVDENTQACEQEEVISAHIEGKLVACEDAPFVMENQACKNWPPATDENEDMDTNFALEAVASAFEAKEIVEPEPAAKPLEEEVCLLTPAEGDEGTQTTNASEGMDITITAAPGQGVTAEDLCFDSTQVDMEPFSEGVASGRSDNQISQDWVAVDRFAAADEEFEGTLVTDNSGRPSLVGNYLTGRIWGRKKVIGSSNMAARESVHLRKQTQSNRKLSSEWRLDNALTEALAGKDHFGEGRVRTLVQAFERVISLTECEPQLPRHAHRTFSFCPRGRQPDSAVVSLVREDTQTRVSVTQWIDIDVTSAYEGENEENMEHVIETQQEDLRASHFKIRGSGFFDSEELECIYREFAGLNDMKYAIHTVATTPVTSNASDQVAADRTEGTGSVDADHEQRISSPASLDIATEMVESVDGRQRFAAGEGEEEGDADEAELCYQMSPENEFPVTAATCVSAANESGAERQGENLGQEDLYEEASKSLSADGGVNLRKKKTWDIPTGQACHWGLKGSSAPHSKGREIDVQPFKLLTEQRGAMHELEFLRKVQHMFAEEQRRRIPIARGLPWTTDEPEVVPKPPVKEQTKPVEFRLISAARARDRAEFDRIVAEHHCYLAAEKQAEDKLRQMAEQEEIRKMRQEMVPRAQLMPFFDHPFQPRRSSKRLTVPREPNFHTPQKRPKYVNRNHGLWQNGLV